MRIVLAAMASVTVLVAACSSADEADDPCPIVGTYTVTGTRESGTCLVPENTAPSTMSITAAEQGSGVDFVFAMQGTTGQCGLQHVAACKLEGTCEVSVTDATTANDRGAIQTSWTFDANGFTGISALTLPPFKDNPDGCTLTTKNTGTRR